MGDGCQGEDKETLPEAMSDIGRKSELKLLGVTFNEHLCNSGTLISITYSAKLALDSTFEESVNTSGTPYKSLKFCLIV